MIGPILYISFDGVLQPLGFSQVVRVIAAIAKRGVSYRLLSLERTRDLENAARVRRVQDLLSQVDIPWTPIGVDLAGSAARSAEAFARMSAATFRITQRSQVAIIHARGYQSALVAHTVRRLTKTPYVFDARGCWIEERPDWFASPAAYAAGKFIERSLYTDAQAVVTLTELHAREVVDGALGRKDATRVVTIPTCADYNEFHISAARPEKPTDSAVVPKDIQRRLRGKNVIAIVGSLNRSYAIVPTVRLIKLACAASDRTHLLVLTQQHDAYAEVLSRADLASDRFTLSGAGHDDMPLWMHWIDWGLLLLPDVAAKRGSMPTKLAEFLATGVRPIAYGCNAEMTTWARRAGTGLVLTDLAEPSLHAAATHIAQHREANDLNEGRERSMLHFSLSSGVARYARLLEQLI